MPAPGWSVLMYPPKSILKSLFFLASGKTLAIVGTTLAGICQDGGEMTSCPKIDASVYIRRLQG